MDIPTHAELLTQVDGFIARHDMSETGFGRAVAQDPNLVASLRAGRDCKASMLRRLAAFMADRDVVAETSDLIGADSSGSEGQSHRLTAAGR